MQAVGANSEPFGLARRVRGAENDESEGGVDGRRADVVACVWYASYMVRGWGVSCKVCVCAPRVWMDGGKGTVKNRLERVVFCSVF